jgi:hypothetical protein
VQPYGPFEGRRARVHVALRRRQVAVSGELLDRPHRRTAHRKTRAEGVTQDVHALLRQSGPLRRSASPPSSTTRCACASTRSAASMMLAYSSKSQNSAWRFGTSSKSETNSHQSQHSVWTGITGKGNCRESHR